MQIVIEIILCAIIVAGAFLGVKKGFITIMAKPVKVIASIVLAFIICEGVATNVVVPLIEAPITNYITDFLYANCSGLTAENIEKELPTILKISASAFNIDVKELAIDSEGSVLNSVISELTMPVIEIMAVAIAFVISYVVLRILLWVAFGLINLLFKGGLFGLLNKSLGFVLGTVLSFAAAWAVAVLMEFIFHIPAVSASEVIADFEGGFFYTFFNTYSPIELLLSF